MFKFPTQSCQRVPPVFCFLFTSMLAIYTQPVNSQTIIPSHESKRPIAGLSRILRQPAAIEIAPLSFRYVSTFNPMSSARPAIVQYQRVPRDPETVRKDNERPDEILNQVVVGGAAGFLAGIFALRGTDNPGIHLAAGISLGALSSIPFYKHSDHPTRFILYGAGAGGVTAGLLSLLSQ